MNICQLFNTELPVIQAPMAGVQDYRLVAAVSNAGGLGSLPCALFTPEQLEQQMSNLRQATDKPINVNFFCHTPAQPDPLVEARWRDSLQPYYLELGIDPSVIPVGAGRSPFSDTMADVLEAYCPDVVSFHFGLPAEYLLERVRSWGSKVIATATTVEEAIWLEQQGVDAIIAQGLEAGGHRGIFLTRDMTTQMGTMALVPQVIGAVSLPVVAAGGIADSAGVQAALALGAAGVQVGTAYLLCDEATTSSIHRAALLSPAAQHTALTNLFSGGPARGIVNRVMQEQGPISSSAPVFPMATAAISPLRAAAEARGSGDFSPLWSGQNNSACREISAAQMTRELMTGII